MRLNPLASLAVAALVASPLAAFAQADAPTAAKAPEAKKEAAAVSTSADAASEIAPDFSLKDESGVEHKLADSKGKVVVLVWLNPGSAKDGTLEGGCPFVMDRVKQGSINHIADAAAKDGAVFYAVNSSSFNKPEDSKGVADAFKQTYKTLQDPDGKVGKAYGAKTTPHAIVIGQDGSIAYNGAINDNTGVDPSKDAAAKDYVGDAVKAALKGQKPVVTKTKPYGCGVKYAKS